MTLMMVPPVSGPELGSMVSTVRLLTSHQNEADVRLKSCPLLLTRMLKEVVLQEVVVGTLQTTHVSFTK
jgi:hypothetical protein